MSIDIEPILTANELDWHFTLKDYPEFSLVALTAGQARAQRQAVISSPTTVDIAHGEIVGNKPGAVANKFSRLAEWVHRVEPGE